MVEAIHFLPASSYNTIACFVTMESPGEAAFMIRALNNTEAFGTIIYASLAVEKNDKRKKLHPEEEWIQWYPLEIRNFPHWTVPDDIKATISTVGPSSQRVRIMHYDPLPTLSIARAYFREEADRDASLKELAGYEFSPGYPLSAEALPRTPGTGPGTLQLQQQWQKWEQPSEPSEDSQQPRQPQQPQQLQQPQLSQPSAFNPNLVAMSMMPALNIPNRPTMPMLNIPGGGALVENAMFPPAVFPMGWMPSVG